MATKAQLRAALKKQGGTWDESGETFDAPAGRNWAASDCHSIPERYDDFLTTPQNYDGMIEQIKMGTYPCTDPNCELC